MNILNQKKLIQTIAEFSCDDYDAPSLFVADYASYNEGHICGAWFDLTNFPDYESFLEKVDTFFKELDKVAPLDSFLPREEIMYQDFQLFPRQFYSESCVDQKLWDYLDFCNISDDNKEIIDAYISCIGDLPDDLSIIKELYFGKLDSSGHNIQQKLAFLMEDHGILSVPDHLQMYFNYEAYGSDIESHYSIEDPYVFRS